MFAWAGSSEAQFNQGSLTGVYGVSGSGILLNLPATVVGINSFDGVGGCVIQVTLNTALLPGALIPLNSIPGQCTYTVNPDGRGLILVTLLGPTGPLPFTSSFVITNTLQQLLFILVDRFGGGTLASGVSRKQ